MPEHPSHQPTRRGTSRPLIALVAALLGPAVAVLVYLSLLGFFGKPILRSDLVLCLLVLALSFPARNRFQDPLMPALAGVFGAWVGLLAVLALAALATSSVDLFDPKLLLWWALLTPLAQGLVVWAGQQLLRGFAMRRRNRRAAVVIGAGALGVRVAHALADRRDRVVDFGGYFDDRSDERVHLDAASRRLGALKDAAAYVREHAIRDVYVTLPLGSQARIAELLKQLQGTTASVYFVPDAFGIDIVRGRLQDLNGLTVVDIGQAAPSGVDRLVRLVADRLLFVPLLLGIALAAEFGLPGRPDLQRSASGSDAAAGFESRGWRLPTRDDPSVRQRFEGRAPLAAARAFVHGAAPYRRPQAIDVGRGATRLQFLPSFGPSLGERREAFGVRTPSSRAAPWRARSLHRQVAAAQDDLSHILAASWRDFPSMPRPAGDQLRRARPLVP